MPRCQCFSRATAAISSTSTTPDGNLSACSQPRVYFSLCSRDLRCTAQRWFFTSPMSRDPSKVAFSSMIRSNCHRAALPDNCLKSEGLSRERFAPLIIINFCYLNTSFFNSLCFTFGGFNWRWRNDPMKSTIIFSLFYTKKMVSSVIQF